MRKNIKPHPYVFLLPHERKLLRVLWAWQHGRVHINVLVKSLNLDVNIGNVIDITNTIQRLYNLQYIDYDIEGHWIVPYFKELGWRTVEKMDRLTV
jgi:hypothetical protein